MQGQSFPLDAGEPKGAMLEKNDTDPMLQSVNRVPFAIGMRMAHACTGRVISSVAWAGLALFASVDLVWFIFSPMVFEPANFRLLGQSILIYGGLYAVPQLVAFRLIGDNSPISKFILRMSDKGARFLSAIVFILGFGFAGCTFTYLAASLGWPLQDAKLVARRFFPRV